MSLAGTGGGSASAQKIAGTASSGSTGISINATTGSLGIGASTGVAGIDNTYVGNAAAASSTTGSFNALLGFGAARTIASDYNVAIGASAGSSCTSGGRNTVVGAQADVSGAADVGSVVVGYGARSRGAGGVVIGASAVGGLGAGSLNIANRITASNGDAGYTLVLGGAGVDFVRLSPTSRVQIDAPVVLTAPDAGRTPWWRMGTAESPDGGGGSNAYRLEFLSRNNTLVAFDDEFAPGVLNFTGSHRCGLASEATCELRVGCLLVATGAYHNLDGSAAPGIDEAVPVVDVTRAQEDPRVFGVLAGFEDPGAAWRSFGLGHLRFGVPRAGGDRRRVVVNSVGEGGVLVCSWAGPVRNGDLLTSSPLPGLAMRQRSRALANHTVAKATCDCDFSTPLEERRWRGRAVRVAFIGCSYRC